jgi:hypothetical protein
MNTGNASTTDPKAFKTFAEFYPFYLGEHRNRTCRRASSARSTASSATG